MLVHKLGALFLKLDNKACCTVINVSIQVNLPCVFFSKDGVFEVDFAKVSELLARESGCAVTTHTSGKQRIASFSCPVCCLLCHSASFA